MACKRISAAIERRLSKTPQDCALPLRGTLKNYWKLRVGNYRVVFKIHGQDLWVLAIGHRRDIYERTLKRMP
jgi:mRNA interferase RelE/StbE